MDALAGADGRVYGGNEFDQIEKQNGDDICDVFIRNHSVIKNHGNGPPKRITVDEQKRDLRKQSLGAMPTHEICAIPVAGVKDECGDQIDDRQWQSGHQGYQRHEVTVGSFFGFAFRRLVYERGGRNHNPFDMLQIQLISISAPAVIATLGCLNQISNF